MKTLRKEARGTVPVERCQAKRSACGGAEIANLAKLKVTIPGMITALGRLRGGAARRRRPERRCPDRVEQVGGRIRTGAPPPLSSPGPAPQAGTPECQHAIARHALRGSGIEHMSLLGECPLQNPASAPIY
jgi:hypothetical protein